MAEREAKMEYIIQVAYKHSAEGCADGNIGWQILQGRELRLPGWGCRVQSAILVAIFQEHVRGVGT